MSQSTALWVNIYAHLRRFDQPLLCSLAPHIQISEWQFCQTPDETSCLNVPVQMLGTYLSNLEEPPHLVGHGTAGVVALLVARRYPQWVRSLTLLGVGAQCGRDWTAYYYAQLQTFQHSRRQALAQLVVDLFGPQNQAGMRYLVQALQQTLLSSPSQHSLLQTTTYAPAGVPVPLLACGSLNDRIVNARALYQWLPWQKNCDRIWHCPQGRHFFHSYYPHLVSEQILDFWQSGPGDAANTDVQDALSSLSI